MKKLLYYLLFIYLLSHPALSSNEGGGKLNQKDNNISQEVRFLSGTLSKYYENRATTLKNTFQGSLPQQLFALSQFLILGMIIFFPVFVHINVKRLRENFSKKISSDDEAAFWLQTDRKVLQIWNKRLSPFAPWLIQILALWIVQKLLKLSIIPELSILVPYVLYYMFYKVFKRFVMLTLMSLTTQIKLRRSKEIEKKIEKSSKLSGRFFLTGLLLHHTFESFIGKNALYDISKNLFVVLGATLLLYLAQVWKEENILIINRRTKGKWAQKVAELSKSHLKFVAGIPIFILSVFFTITAIIRKWSDEFDISKRVSARFFRKQLENSESFKSDELKSLPDDYRSELTTNPDTGGDFNKEELEEIKESINEWLEEKSDEHSLAIYGDTGIGKSAILRNLEAHYSDIHVIHVSVPAKTTTRKQVRDFISSILETKIDEGHENFIKNDQERKSTLVLLDKAHNMFLSKVNGLEGYREFLNIINAQTQNIFWCASFHSYSWKLLDTIFKKNQYFRSAKLIPRWTEDEIRSLIMERHNKTSYEISFNRMLEATHTIDETLTIKNIQTKFFRLIWEQSYGNPESALAHWLSALKLENENEKTLCVTLPEVITQGMSLSEMPDEALFVYTALIKHENLSQSEAIEVTNLTKGEVNYAFKVGLETGSLTRDKKGRYQVSTLKQPSLVSQLKKKNFIYGNE